MQMVEHIALGISVALNIGIALLLLRAMPTRFM